MDIIGKFDKYYNRVIDILFAFSGVLIIYSVLTISGEVVTRNFFGKTTSWVLETNEYALLYITFLVAAYLLRKEGHVIMDVVISRVNVKTQLPIIIFISIISAVVCFFIAWYGALVVWDHYQIGYMFIKGLKIPSVPILIVIPVGCLLLGIQFLVRVYSKFKSFKSLQYPEI